MVGIIGILAAVAIPAYSKYTKKAKFTEVVQVTQAIKTAIESCVSDQGTFMNCFAGTQGLGTVAGATSAGSATVNFGKYLSYVGAGPNATQAGWTSTTAQINAAAVSASGLAGETYELDGTLTPRGNLDYQRE